MSERHTTVAWWVLSRCLLGRCLAGSSSSEGECRSLNVLGARQIERKTSLAQHSLVTGRPCVC